MGHLRGDIDAHAEVLNGLLLIALFQAFLCLFPIFLSVCISVFLDALFHFEFSAIKNDHWSHLASLKHFDPANAVLNQLINTLPFGQVLGARVSCFVKPAVGIDCDSLSRVTLYIFLPLAKIF